MTPTLANAPVSYGVFERTVGTGRYLAPPERLLDEVAAAGYQGIDLGPAGYLGEGADLAMRLSRRGLGISGGYVELPFHEPAALVGAWAALDAVLDALGATQGAVAGPPPRPTLAAAGTDARRRRPGQAQSDRSLGLDDHGWEVFGDGLNAAVRRCRDRGLEPTFHPHVGTLVEAPWEIERVLALSDVGLCFDTGHLMIGGADPVPAARNWAAFINHVHLKDARMSLMAQIVAEGGASDQVWSRGVFCPLGQGDLNTDGVLAALRAVGYSGWIVVEQDVFTPTQQAFESAVADQLANRQLLSDLGL